MASFSLRNELRSFFFVCLFLLSPAVAFPYGKSSAVTELTPASLSNFVNTHKPVVILFYAPWCGHCKHFHPEFERFAQSVKGTMRVGALDADQYSSIGQQYGVRGFPTIKYWKMGTKSLASPQDYEGQRTASALQSFMVADITAAHVKTVATTEQLKQAARDAPQKKVGVLFSAKDKVPPMLSVMALSPKLKNFPLAFVGGSLPNKGVALSFNVAQLPTLGVLQYTPAVAGGAEEEKFDFVPYTKKVIAYEPVAQFFLDCVEQECDNGKGDVAPIDVETRVTEVEEKEEHGQHAHQRHPHHNRAKHHQPHVALPVKPVEFTNETIANFCSPRALKIRGRSPMCVISLTTRVNLANLHNQFQSDSLLFFDAAQHKAEVLQQFQTNFGVALSTDAASDSGAVLLMRHGQPTKMRHTLLDGMNSDSDLQRMLQKVLNGELRLRKMDVELSDGKEE